MLDQKKIKVLFLIDTLEFGGAERSLVEITTRLKNAEPIFIQVYKGDELKKTLEENNIAVYSLDIVKKYGFSEATEKLKKLIDKIDPDIIHASLIRSSLISRRLKSTFNIPLINSFTSNSYISSRFKKLPFANRLKLKYIQCYDRYTTSKVDLFISNSETIKANNIKALALNPDKIKVIPRGREANEYCFNKNDIKNIRERLEFEGKKVILNVGRLIKTKGQKDLIQAYAKIVDKHPNSLLLIAGEGPFRSELENEIIKLELNNVKLLGNRKDIPELLAASDIFAFPTYLEGLPGSLIEAMFSRIPIIASDIPENLECVSPETAVIFEKGNIDNLASKLDSAIKESNHDEKTEKAYEFALKNFSIQNIVEQYELVYKEILNKS